MHVSERAGEINFYEELGVAPAASAEEIRDAFRALARLLHPDQHTDIHLKKVAEAQMRKLNGIYAVLSDPERRREYDEFLGEEDLPPVTEDRFRLSPDTRRIFARVGWAGGIVCGLGLLIWFTAESTPNLQSREPEQVQPSQPAAAPPPAMRSDPRDQEVIASLRSDLKAVTMERDAAIRELTRLRGSQALKNPAEAAPSETPEISLPSVAMTELPSSAVRLAPPLNVTSPRTEKSAGHKLGGFWFYAPPPSGQHNKNQALYLPEYIEATISEENGVIHGKYRARFHIADQTISPDVNFTFTGASNNASQATFPWTGPGGAKGEVTVKFMSENSLRVDWNATEPGSQQGLNAGTAVLTRRAE